MVRRHPRERPWKRQPEQKRSSCLPGKAEPRDLEAHPTRLLALAYSAQLRTLVLRFQGLQFLTGFQLRLEDR